MSDFKAEYTFDAVNKSGSIEPKGCNALTLRNVGDDPVKINGIIPLQTDEEFTLDNHYRTEIASNLDVRFDGTGTSPNLVIIRKFIRKK